MADVVTSFRMDFHKSNLRKEEVHEWGPPLTDAFENFKNQDKIQKKIRNFPN